MAHPQGRIVAQSLCEGLRKGDLEGEREEQNGMQSKRLNKVYLRTGHIEVPPRSFPLSHANTFTALLICTCRQFTPVQPVFTSQCAHERTIDLPRGFRSHVMAQRREVAHACWTRSLSSQDLTRLWSLITNRANMKAWSSCRHAVLFSPCR